MFVKYVFSYLHVLEYVRQKQLEGFDGVTEYSIAKNFSLIDNLKVIKKMINFLVGRGMLERFNAKSDHQRRIVTKYRLTKEAVQTLKRYGLGSFLEDSDFVRKSIEKSKKRSKINKYKEWYPFV